MFCSRCGYDNNESNVYCFNCGNLLISGRNEKNECGTTLFEEMKLRRERQERENEAYEMDKWTWEDSW